MTTIGHIPGTVGGRSDRRRTGCIAAVAAWVAILALAERTDAALVFTIEPSSTTFLAGSTGNYFDVIVSRTGVSNPGDSGFSSYNVSLTLPGATGLDFTSVGEISTPGRPYPFVGGGAPTPLEVQSPGVHTVDYTDTFGGLGSPPSFAPGQTYRLGRLFFDVDALAGSSTFNVAFNAAATTVTGPVPDVSNSYTPISVSVVNPAAVPEPSSFALLGVCSVIGLGYRWKRRQESLAT